MQAPSSRIRDVNAKPPSARGDYVLYWMNASRRTRYNVALQHAWALACARRVPLLVLEAIGVDYRWASDRHHAFVLEGMRDNALRLGGAYYPYVERSVGEGRGLVAALGRAAVQVVTDDWPGFHLPNLVSAAGRQLDVSLVAVDSCGVLPVSDAPEAPFPTAYAFRRHLQRRLAVHLSAMPLEDPLPAELPVPAVDAAIEARWPRGLEVTVGELPIDHGVAPIASFPGGPLAAARRLDAFLARLPRYDEERNDPGADATSGLSPYLHFGHLSSHEVLTRILDAHGWDPSTVKTGGDGSRAGWWGLPPPAEAFLDQLVTWRELGFNLVSRTPDASGWASLPAWARATLDAHRGDPRPHVYDFRTFENAATHDPLWNAAQRQLRAEGRIHNYLRMLWGKKILEWSASPEEALDIAFALNDRWALDGRDPNTATSIGWIFGRHDRPWGPVRPIFGTVRWMSSENTAKKLDIKGYVRRWGPAPASSLFEYAASPLDEAP
jgi:deoxyribodipyrimidine photo-lyase